MRRSTPVLLALAMGSLGHTLELDPSSRRAYSLVLTGHELPVDLDFSHPLERSP